MKSQLLERHGRHCRNRNRRFLSFLRVAVWTLLTSTFSGCSSSNFPYPITSVPRSLDSRADGSWTEATLHVALGNCEWVDSGEFFVLRSTVSISNSTRKNVYFLKEDISEQDYVIESVGDKNTVKGIFSGTRPGGLGFSSNSLMFLAPDDKLVLPVEWKCIPRRNESGLSFRVDDYVVDAGSDVRLCYWLRSMVWLVVIDAANDSTYVDMWALADDPNNSFQTDSSTDWVTVTFPDKEPGQLNNLNR